MAHFGRIIPFLKPQSTNADPHQAFLILLEFSEPYVGPHISVTLDTVKGMQCYMSVTLFGVTSAKPGKAEFL